jgi:hypothetical protein
MVTNIILAAIEILTLPQLRLRTAFNDDKKLSWMIPETLSNAVVDLLR